MLVVGVAVIAGVIGLAVAQLGDYHDPESEADFEQLVLRSERLAKENLAKNWKHRQLIEQNPSQGRRK